MKEELLQIVNGVSDLKELDRVRVEILGKKGKIQSLMKRIKELPPQERKEYGRSVNELKSLITDAIEKKRRELEELEKKRYFERIWIDVTIPGATRKLGHNHPVLMTLR